MGWVESQLCEQFSVCSGLSQLCEQLSVWGELTVSYESSLVCVMS